MSAYYISVFLSILAILLALSARQAMHGILYLLFGLIALAFNLSLLGSGYGAVLLMIIYAGAIMVLFVFVVMLLNQPPSHLEVTVGALARQFLGPLMLGLCVFAFMIFATSTSAVNAIQGAEPFSVKAIAEALFRDGWFFIELISLLLTAALIGAFHVGKRQES